MLICTNITKINHFKLIYSIRYITFASDINTKYNMNMIGVITGDIIDSTKMDIESRNNLLISIEEVTKELKVLSPLYIYNEDGTYTDEVLKIYNKK